MSKRSDAPECVVCGCTDERACDEGCSWVLGDPPLCSSCIQPYLFAKLWAVVFALEDKAKGEPAKLIREIRAYYSFLNDEYGGVPTLRKICAINRRAAKSREAKAR
jgi:hypothetical protein